MAGAHPALRADVPGADAVDLHPDGVRRRRPAVCHNLRDDAGGPVRRHRLPDAQGLAGKQPELQPDHGLDGVFWYFLDCRGLR